MKEKKAVKGISLSRDEKILHSGGRCWRSGILWLISAILWMFVGLFFPLLFFMGLIFFAATVIRIPWFTYVLTDKGVHTRHRNLFDVEYHHVTWGEIRGISMVMSNTGEILDFGNITLILTEREPMVLKDVKTPKRLMEFMDDLR